MRHRSGAIQRPHDCQIEPLPIKLLCRHRLCLCHWHKQAGCTKPVPLGLGEVKINLSLCHGTSHIPPSGHSLCHDTNSIPQWSLYLFHLCQLVTKNGSTRPWMLSKGSTLLRGCWFWSKKLHFQKNFRRNFITVQGVNYPTLRVEESVKTETHSTTRFVKLQSKDDTLYLPLKSPDYWGVRKRFSSFQNLPDFWGRNEPTNFRFFWIVRFKNNHSCDPLFWIMYA